MLSINLFLSHCLFSCNEPIRLEPPMPFPPCKRLEVLPGSNLEPNQEVFLYRLRPFYGHISIHLGESEFR